MSRHLVCFIAGLVMSQVITHAAPQPFSTQFGSASARFDGQTLVVSSGLFERTWILVPGGLATTRVRDVKRDRTVAQADAPPACDFAIPGLSGDATLVSIEARESDDDGLCAKHLEVSAVFDIGTSQVKHVVWAYPDVPGLRTQLFVRNLPASAERREPWQGPGLEMIDAMPDRPVGSAIRATRISNEGTYQLGLSTSGPIEISSTDGETIATVSPNAGGLYDVPRDTQIGNVFVARGADRINEAWLYEKTNADRATPPGEAKRIEAIARAAPAGMKLIAYWRPTPDAGALPPLPSGRADFVPIDASSATRRYAGYYNDTQHRNTAKTPLLKEIVSTNSIATREGNDWANLAAVSNGNIGLALLKESHKCVNQPGVDTGGFIAMKAGLASTGLASPPTGSNAFEWCWANWLVLFDGTELGLQSSVKAFDRARFPHDPARDEWVKVCTWGHSLSGRDGCDAAVESAVLPEMKGAADLGIDLFLIDAGWQISKKATAARPDGGVGWKPHPEVYPEGWKNVIASAKANGLRLAIWGDASQIPLDDMLWNEKELSPLLVSFKLDFGSFNTHAKLSAIREQARQFLLKTNHRTAISWDVTENAPRVGYYWAREFGPVKMTNRKPVSPANAVYIPWLVLRDTWQLARYQNLSKWQIIVHDPRLIDRKLSDAHRYTMSYCFATSLMGVPELFCLPGRMDSQSRDELKRMIAIYKPERARIFASTVYPIGDEPNGKSWTGFQAMHPDGSGYLTLFREIDNADAEATIELVGYANRPVTVQDLVAGTKQTVAVDMSGNARFRLDAPGSFLFARIYTD